MIPQFKVLMSDEAAPAVSNVLNSGYIGQGPKVDEFENELQKILKFENAITVNSATSGLWLALHLIGVGPGDKVISTPMTCSATNEVITLIGADIIWADVDEYGNISPEDISRKLNKKVKAIMAVDWGGLPCDYDAIREAAPGIPIVEDAAHSFMATYKNQPISISGGDYVVFSFQAIKHLTCGDGGLLVTPTEQFERAKLLRWYGLDRKSSDAMRCRQDIPEAGFKFHMNDINATIGLKNIDAALEGLEANRENARFYDAFYVNRIVSAPPEDRVSSNWIYTIHVPDPIRFEWFMKENGISVSQVHNRNDKFSCFSDYSTSLPNLDEWFSTMCCIPVGWWLSQKDLHKIVEVVDVYLRRHPVY